MPKNPNRAGYAKDAPTSLSAPLDDLRFDRDGVVLLRSAFDASGMVDEVWGVLSRRFGMLRQDPTTWRAGWFGKLTKWGKTGRFAAIATPSIGDAVSSLFESDAHTIGRWGQPLITFPTPGPWIAPSSWHIDHPAGLSLAAIRMFAYLAPVPSQAGGTLVVTGSHHLASELIGIRSADVTRHLASRSPWFGDLFGPGRTAEENDRFLDPGTVVDGVHVRVVELTSDPGDVILWHPSLLHTIAPNCSSSPRFMLTNTAYRSA